MSKILVTGTAGFIGFHLARRLLDDGHTVIGIDGMTPYYDVTLKEDRHKILSKSPSFQSHVLMLEDRAALSAVVERHEPEVIVHLAAQAGVRYSLENPRAYVDSNIIGTFNVMELTRTLKVRHFLLASTSSVYGANEKIPFIETERCAHQLTLYAASKMATEVMTHSYSHLWKIPTTVFRFFTVFGPWGRPDMALFKFVKGITSDQPIDIYNDGKMQRDFTYIDDLVESIRRLIDCAPVTDDGKKIPGDSISPVAPHRIVNIGGGAPVGLLDFIDEIETVIGKKAIRNYMPMQAGDVPRNFADPQLLEQLTGYRPDTSYKAGIKAFVDWYLQYYSSERAALLQRTN